MIYEDVDAHVALELKDFVANVNNFWITRIEGISEISQNNIIIV